MFRIQVLYIVDYRLAHLVEVLLVDLQQSSSLVVIMILALARTRLRLRSQIDVLLLFWLGHVLRELQCFLPSRPLPIYRFLFFPVLILSVVYRLHSHTLGKFILLLFLSLC